MMGALEKTFCSSVPIGPIEVGGCDTPLVFVDRREVWDSRAVGDDERATVFSEGAF